MMKKLLVVLLVSLIFTPVLLWAGSSLTIKGSDTMIILVQRWAEEYMKTNPGEVVQVTGGGSGTGISALITGSTDICMASRPISPKESGEIKEKQGKAAVEIPVALDGIGIYVYSSNKVNQLSFPQLQKIFMGQVHNWKEVGGADMVIVPYGRENNSGTYVFFQEHVLDKKDFAPEVQSLPGTAAIVNAVSKDEKAIGYGGIGYNKGVKVLKISKEPTGKALEPTMKNVMSRKYPLSRYLYFYTVGQPSPSAKKFIDWVAGKQGQEVCQKVGYYPLKRSGK